MVTRYEPDGNSRIENPLVVLQGDACVIVSGLDKVDSKILEDLKVTMVLNCAGDIKFRCPLKGVICLNVRRMKSEPDNHLARLNHLTDDDGLRHGRLFRDLRFSSLSHPR